MTVLSATILLFLVIDPIGNVPFFLTALKDVDPSRHMLIVARELLIALAVLIGFLFAGPAVLAAIHISQPSLTVAGGIILFLIALRMVFPLTKSPGAPDMVQGEPFMVPLAIPLIAGPSAMAALLMISSQEPDRRTAWLGALVLAWLLSSAIILGASRLKDLLGVRGLIAVERLMGMVLVAVAVQMLMTGVVEFVQSI